MAMQGEGTVKSDAVQTKTTPMQQAAAKAPAPAAATKKLPLTSENLKKWVAAGEGLEFIKDQTGASTFKVKKALREAGLKTARMLAVNPVSTQNQIGVYRLIDEGNDTIEKLVAAGVDEEVAIATTRKMLRDGSIELAFKTVPVV